MILRARALVTMAGPPIDDGAVVIQEGSIAAAGAFADLRPHHSGPVDDLGEQVILPGLINAHCHLDYTMMRGAITRPRSFTDWIRRINALKRSLGPDDYLAAISAGFRQLAENGVTTVFNIEAFPELLLSMDPPPIRTWWFYEMIDIRHRVPTEETVAGVLSFFDGKPGWRGGFGLSPHAPYTASVDLYQRTKAAGAAFNMPVTTHVAESLEEDRMFRAREGALFDFLVSLGRPMNDCAGHSGFFNLIQADAIDARTLLVHMNELAEEDFELIETRLPKRRLHIVHCPRSHAYFGHSPFAFERLQRGGANISLGTDSLASCDSLNLFAEMRAAQVTNPWLQPSALLETVTVNPGRALQPEGGLGQLVPGAPADLISLPFADRLETVYDHIVANERRVRWMMIDGQTTIP